MSEWVGEGWLNLGPKVIPVRMEMKSKIYRTP